MASSKGKREGKGTGRSTERPAGAARELEDALAGIAPPEDELDAGFFHRTLARWLGLPEGKGEPPSPVLWSYELWKAEIVSLGATQGRSRFAAQVTRGPDARVERYEYWLELDEAHRIRRSGWVTRAPDLCSDGAAAAPPPPPSAASLAALFGEPE